MHRFLVVFPILLLVACSSAEATSSAEDESPAAGHADLRATRVEVAVVRPTRAALQTRWPGEVVGSRDALLAAAMGGFIERVSVEEGDEVEENQVLIRVDTASAGARVAQARVEVDAAQRELERAERLSGAISEQQLDGARTRLAGARAALRSAAVLSSRALIRAPFAGVVAQLDAERGEVAAPGAPLLRLVQLTPVHVTISVPDRDVTLLRPGMPVNVRVDATAEPVHGEILRISPAADLRTRAFEVRVLVQNEHRRLLPGMIAEVQAAGGATEEAIVIPQHTLVTGIDANGVFIEGGGIAHWRPIEAGRVLRDQVVIESGLTGGERLIVTGHRELAEGDTVLVVREGFCCQAGRVVFGQEGAAAAPSGAAAAPSAPAAPTGQTAAADPGPATEGNTP